METWKVYMSSRPGCPVNRKHDGEECFFCMWELGHTTNMDRLEEAVRFTEEDLHGWVVIAAYIDWGNAPCVVMRRLVDGQECMYMGNDTDEDWGFFGTLSDEKVER